MKKILVAFLSVSSIVLGALLCWRALAQKDAWSVVNLILYAVIIVVAVLIYDKMSKQIKSLMSEVSSLKETEEMLTKLLLETQDEFQLTPEEIAELQDEEIGISKSDAGLKKKIFTKIKNFLTRDDFDKSIS